MSGPKTSEIRVSSRVRRLNEANVAVSIAKAVAVGVGAVALGAGALGVAAIGVAGAAAVGVAKATTAAVRFAGSEIDQALQKAEQERQARAARLRQQKIAAENASIRSVLLELNAIAADTSALIPLVQELHLRTESGAAYLRVLERTSQQVREDLDAHTDAWESSDAAVLEERRKSLQERLRSVRRELEAFSEERHNLERLLQDARDNDAYRDYILARLGQIPLEFLSPELASKLRTEMEQLEAMENTTHIKSNVALVTLPLEQRCREHLSFYEQHIDSFGELLASYHYLCSELGWEAEEFGFSKEGLRQLEQANDEAKEAAVQMLDDAYIMQTVNRIMAEMDYPLLGERNSDRRSKQKLYAFDADNATGVNVHYAANGSITMELVGLDKVDRAPQSQEIGRLCADMEAFCEDYADIVERLSMEGIEIARVPHRELPPTAEFGQILNVADYQLADPSFMPGPIQPMPVSDQASEVTQTEALPSTDGSTSRRRGAAARSSRIQTLSRERR